MFYVFLWGSNLCCRHHKNRWLNVPKISNLFFFMNVSGCWFGFGWWWEQIWTTPYQAHANACSVDKRLQSCILILCLLLLCQSLHSKQGLWRQNVLELVILCHIFDQILKVNDSPLLECSINIPFKNFVLAFTTLDESVLKINYMYSVRHSINLFLWVAFYMYFYSSVLLGFLNVSCFLHEDRMLWFVLFPC